MKTTVLFVFALLILQSCSNESSNDFTAIQLKCNNLENPTGTDRTLVFSLIVSSRTRGEQQTAYQIVLDSGLKDIKSESDCIWNSGKISERGMTLRVRIPVNCKAVIEIPRSNPELITESGIPVRQSESVKVIEVLNGKTRCAVSSGEYIFCFQTVRNKRLEG